LAIVWCNCSQEFASVACNSLVPEIVNNKSETLAGDSPENKVGCELNNSRDNTSYLSEDIAEKKF